VGRLRTLGLALGSGVISVVAIVGVSAVRERSVALARDRSANITVHASVIQEDTRAGAVDEIGWHRVTRGDGFTTDPVVSQVAQLPDGGIVIVGAVTDSVGRSTGAVWRSTDVGAWSRVKMAPEGSHISAVARLGPSLVALGEADDGTSLAWTSTDGSSWLSSVPPRGTVAHLVSTAAGLEAVGASNGGATVWRSTDGTTWLPQSLSPGGQALAIATAPNGSEVIAGVVTDGARKQMPTVWTSTQDSGWIRRPLPGLVPGSWSVAALAWTPAGYVLIISEHGGHRASSHVWSSGDGASWTAAMVDETGPLSYAGTDGAQAMLVGDGHLWRSLDGRSWIASNEPSFDGWTVRDVITLADGRLFAAGDTISANGHSEMAVWTEYAAVFAGDATGATDVTDALRTFLESNDGKRVALARDGVYQVTQVAFTAHDLIVDFRGAHIQGSRPGVHGILRVQSSSHVILNDPTVYGTGYVWDPVTQFEHGIHVDGGSDIILNHPTTRDTRGDGIYVGYRAGIDLPPVRIVVRDPDVQRASRNGIAPVAGQVTIRGGRIDRVGLHGIDFEPNDRVGAASIRGVVTGVDIRDHGDLPTGHTSFAVAAVSGIPAPRHSLVLKRLTGDDLRMSIRRTTRVVVRRNVSGRLTTADFPGSGSVTFADNVRIRRR
jgi:hypothetical protein